MVDRSHKNALARAAKARRAVKMLDPAGPPRNCTFCKELKQPTGFSKNNPYYCIPCMRELSRGYNQTPKRREAHRIAQRNNPRVVAYKKKRFSDPTTRLKEREGANRRNRRYYLKNKDRCFDHANRYRARKKAVTVGDVDRIQIAERDRWICYLCAKAVSPDENWSLDHVIPIIKGGPHHESNLKLAHLSCNQRKGVLMPEEFEQRHSVTLLLGDGK